MDETQLESGPGARARSIPRRKAETLVLFLVTCTLACAPARAGEAVDGTVRDADTNEPIGGAWIFETLREPGVVGADVLRVDRVRIARTDADGEFSFDGESGFFDLGRRYPPTYQLFHPSYGLIRGRADENGPRVTFRPSLRDAHLRQADATAFCNAPVRDEMVEKMVELACPPARLERFDDGSPRAEGPRDERGRRDGEWTFYRDDGSVIARGRYRDGAAVGTWAFEPPQPRGRDDD